jgi:hypothetical protein
MSATQGASFRAHSPSAERAGVLVVGCLLAVSVPLGFLAYARFKTANSWLRGAIDAAHQTGKTASAEQCVDQSLELRRACSTLPALCDHAVGDTMETCLQARVRTDECAAQEQEIHSTRFGFDACSGRKVDRALRIACATAYRSIAEHCDSLRRGP